MLSRQPGWDTEPEETLVQTVTEQKVERTTIEYVAYSRLILSPLNVRKKAPTGIEALAATLAEKGILQNLVGHEMKGRSKQPKLGVCAGQRRLAALDLLFSQGRITKDYQVPVLIVSEGEAVAASLIENREREDMCLADEALAFRLLAEEGKSTGHIASLFKVSEMVVRRALKIANLAPALLDLMRDDALDYEQAKSAGPRRRSRDAGARLERRADTVAAPPRRVARGDYADRTRRARQCARKIRRAGRL
jgi:ParB family chromosome partitioning protein